MDGQRHAPISAEADWEEEAVEAEALDIDAYACSQCGGSQSFDPVRQALVCLHCGQIERTTAGDPSDLMERDLAEAFAPESSEETEEARLAACNNCGAEVKLDEVARAESCPFCASPMVVRAPRRRFKAQGVLPFAISEEEAHQALGEWLKSLWFAPGDLARTARAETALVGVYLPHWTFDAQTVSDYRGQRGDVYYVKQWRTVIRNGKSTRKLVKVAKTRWSHRSGTVRKHFDDVLVLASNASEAAWAKALADWDLDELRPFSPDYLAGFRAETYAVAPDEAHQTARTLMDRGIRKAVRFAIGGDKQRISRIDTDFSDESFKHVLLPVWIAAYRYGGESYRFVVNGRTGRAQGDRPYSTGKIALAVLAGLGLLALLLIFGEF